MREGGRTSDHLGRYQVHGRKVYLSLKRSWASVSQMKVHSDPLEELVANTANVCMTMLHILCDGLILCKVPFVLHIKTTKATFYVNTTEICYRVTVY